MFDVIVGLGGAGHKIAKTLQGLNPEPSYFSIDSDIVSYKKFKHIRVPKSKTAEEYEDNFPNVKKQFVGKSGTMLLILAGGGNMSLCSLNFLEQVRKKFKINVLYVKPSNDILNDEQIQKERLVFGVLQEYTRSGVFENLYLVSNDKISECLGGLPLIDYDTKINAALASTFFMICNFNKTKPVVNNFHSVSKLSRISTFGYIDKDRDMMFFDLDNVTDAMYYFGYTEENLKTNTKILGEVKEIVEERKEYINKVSYGIYATSYDHDLVYGQKYTSQIILT